MNLLDHNPFFSGGLTLMVIGSSVAMLRRLPGQIRAFLERRLSITVEIPDRDPAFQWVQGWLAAHRYSRRARAESDDHLGNERPGPVDRQRSRLQPAVRSGLRGEVPAVASARRPSDDVSRPSPPPAPDAPRVAAGRAVGLPGDPGTPAPGGPSGVDRGPARRGAPGVVPEGSRRRHPDGPGRLLVGGGLGVTGAARVARAGGRCPRGHAGRPEGLLLVRRLVRRARHPLSTGLPAARAARDRQDDDGPRPRRRAEGLRRRAEPDEPADDRRRAPDADR